MNTETIKKRDELISEFMDSFVDYDPHYHFIKNAEFCLREIYAQGIRDVIKMMNEDQEIEQGYVSRYAEKSSKDWARNIEKHFAKELEGK